jgi:hypothetical protein
MRQSRQDNFLKLVTPIYEQSCYLFIFSVCYNLVTILVPVKMFVILSLLITYFKQIIFNNNNINNNNNNIFYHIKY